MDFFKDINIVYFPGIIYIQVTTEFSLVVIEKHPKENTLIKRSKRDFVI